MRKLRLSLATIIVLTAVCTVHRAGAQQQYPQLPPSPPPQPGVAQPPPPPPPPPGYAPREPPGPYVATTPSACEEKSSCEEGCACDRHCYRHHCRRKTPSVELSVTGVRPSLTQVSTGTASDTTFGVGFAGSAESYALNGASHGAMDFVLGGGEGGFEGALGGTIDLGYRLPVADDHGPFGRIGFEGRLQGNDLLYYSMLELPKFGLGYQYTHGKTMAEIGARTGFVLTGLYDPSEGGRRKLRGWEYGVGAAAQVEFMKLEFSAMRIEARSTLDGNPVDVGRAQLCGVGSRLGVCLDGALFHGDAELRANNGGVHTTTSSYVGLLIGIAGW